MRSLFLTFSLTSLCFSFAADAHLKLILTPDSSAKLAASLLNNAQTYDGLINLLSPVLTLEERKGIREFYIKAEVKLNTKIPLAIAHDAVAEIKGSKLKIEFQKNGTFKFGDKIFNNTDGKSFDAILRQASGQTISPVKNASTLALFTQAYAEPIIDGPTICHVGPNQSACAALELVALSVNGRTEQTLNAEDKGIVQNGTKGIKISCPSLYLADIDLPDGNKITAQLVDRTEFGDDKYEHKNSESTTPDLLYKCDKTAIQKQLDSDLNQNSTIWIKQNKQPIDSAR
jgi:hypothetical protein